MEETTLIPVTEITPELFQKEKIPGIINKIVEHYSSIVLSGETPQERQECITVANEVRKMKVLIDNTGKDYVSGIKAKAKVIDNQRKEARERLDELTRTLRSPATEWEQREQDRINTCKTYLNEIRRLIMEFGAKIELWTPKLLETTKERIDILIEVEYHEFQTEADELLERLNTVYLNTVETRSKWEKDQADLERLRKIELEKLSEVRIQENEKCIKEQAEALAKRKEQDELQAKRLREADVENRKLKNNEALQDFAALYMDSPPSPKELVIAIANGNIRNVTVNY